MPGTKNMKANLSQNVSTQYDEVLLSPQNITEQVHYTARRSGSSWLPSYIYIYLIYYPINKKYIRRPQRTLETLSLFRLPSLNPLSGIQDVMFMSIGSKSLMAICSPILYLTVDAISSRSGMMPVSGPCMDS